MFATKIDCVLIHLVFLGVIPVDNLSFLFRVSRLDGFRNNECSDSIAIDEGIWTCGYILRLKREIDLAASYDIDEEWHGLISTVDDKAFLNFLRTILDIGCSCLERKNFDEFNFVANI